MEMFALGNLCSEQNSASSSVDNHLTLRYSAEVLSYQRVVVVGAGTGSPPRQMSLAQSERHPERTAPSVVKQSGVRSGLRLWQGRDVAGRDLF
jgi:hypothetical protein